MNEMAVPGQQGNSRDLPLSRKQSHVDTHHVVHAFLYENRAAIAALPPVSQSPKPDLKAWYSFKRSQEPVHARESLTLLGGRRAALKGHAMVVVGPEQLVFPGKLSDQLLEINSVVFKRTQLVQIPTIDERRDHA